MGLKNGDGDDDDDDKQSYIGECLERKSAPPLNALLDAWSGCLDTISGTSKAGAVPHH